MVRRWILYLTVLVGCLIFYLAYLEWFAWFALIGVLCLPVVTQLLSLPAMLSLRLSVSVPGLVGMGEQERLRLHSHCRMPSPPCRCRILVKRNLTGEEWFLKVGEMLPAAHCGLLTCRLVNAKVFDYLGLFGMKIRNSPPAKVVVWPKPVSMEELPELDRHVPRSWHPKPGGGFAEHHELRLYRPGDSLNQIHWKLSAKTGKYIIREPQEAQHSRILIAMELRGTPEELDRYFGQMLWLSEYLLQKGHSHELRVLTGKGVECLPVSNETQMKDAIRQLLAAPPAPEGKRLEPVPGTWQYRIGGDAV